MERYFGIDFGTTNSAVIEYSKYETILIGGSDGKPMPSLVAIDRLNQNITCGLEVKEMLAEYIESGSYHIIKSVKSALDSDKHWSTEDRVWTAKDVTKQLVLALSARVAQVCGEPLHKAVFAIPVGMKPEKRRILREAAQQAGVEVSTFISEPTAAFISLADKLQQYTNIAVFDWGGGTLDISILENNSGYIVEKNTDGSNKAGDYIDEQFARWLHERITEKYRINISFDNVSEKDKQLLIAFAEQCKCDLQREGIEKVRRSLVYLDQRIEGFEITAAEFNGITHSIIDEAIDRLLFAIDKAQLHHEKIGKVIIVGGSSNLLLFRSELNRRWPYPNIIYPDKADWAIAEGAAILAANPGRYCTAESLGVVLSDNEYHTIFPAKASPENGRYKIHFGLVEDSQSATFIFASLADGEYTHRHIGDLHVKAFGFRDEIIELDCHINEDLVFQALAKSQSQGNMPAKFNFDKVRWMYQIPLTK